MSDDFSPANMNPREEIIAAHHARVAAAHKSCSDITQQRGMGGVTPLLEGERATPTARKELTLESLFKDTTVMREHEQIKFCPVNAYKAGYGADAIDAFLVDRFCKKPEYGTDEAANVADAPAKAAHEAAEAAHQVANPSDERAYDAYVAKFKTQRTEYKREVVRTPAIIEEEPSFIISHPDAVAIAEKNGAQMRDRFPQKDQGVKR